jgi:hypothetical protein
MYRIHIRPDKNIPDPTGSGIITLILRFKNIGFNFFDAVCPETKEFDSFYIRIPAGPVNPCRSWKVKLAPGKKRRTHDYNFPGV